MSQSVEWLKAISPCLRSIGEKGRVFPQARHIELVFAVEAANLLLLRTEGPGDINVAKLPEAGVEVPIIQPQKLMAVVRRRMLQALRTYRDSGANLKPFIDEASELGFVKARNEHSKNGWNCTIQPPVAGKGAKATDIGMDGYCPACTIFGAALTNEQWEGIRGDMSLGIKTRVHFDPAFATSRMMIPETHNKVTEGHLATTGGALFNDVHVMPGTIFVGRATLHDLTEPELLAVLYSLATTEEIGGRASVYGTIRVELLGVRCGHYSATTSLDLADEIAKNGLEKPSEILNALRNRVKELGFTLVSNKDVLSLVDPTKTGENAVFTMVWKSSMDYVRQMASWVRELQGGEAKASKELGGGEAKASKKARGSKGGSTQSS